MSTRDSIVALLGEGGKMSSFQLAEALDIPRSSVAYHMTYLLKDGKVRSLGKGRKGGYVLADTPNRPRTPGPEARKTILKALSNGAPLTVRELAEATGLTLSTVRNNTYALQRDGLIVGERGGPNRGYRLSDYAGSVTETQDFFEQDETVMERMRRAFEEGRVVELTEPTASVPNASVEYETPKLKALFEKSTPFSNSNPVTVPVDMFDRVKGLSFPVGVAALALLNNDVVTAKRMLELA